MDLTLLTGATGFSMMLFPLLAYSAKKRLKLKFIHVPLKILLRFHIYNGIIGPGVILIPHSSLKFENLAGVSTFLMLLVVASGFIGRYIYRRVPTAEKVAEIMFLEKKRVDELREMEYFEGNGLHKAGKIKRMQIEKLEREIESLESRLAYIKKMKRFLSHWHTVHIPLTAVFFFSAVLHVYGVIYYR
jgi:hypothetical protein